MVGDGENAIDRSNQILHFSRSRSLLDPSRISLSDWSARYGEEKKYHIMFHVTFGQRTICSISGPGQRRLVSPCKQRRAAKTYGKNPPGLSGKTDFVKRGKKKKMKRIAL